MRSKKFLIKESSQYLSSLVCVCSQKKIFTRYNARFNVVRRQVFVTSLNR